MAHFNSFDVNYFQYHYHFLNYYYGTNLRAINTILLTKYEFYNFLFYFVFSTKYIVL